MSLRLCASAVVLLHGCSTDQKHVDTTRVAASAVPGSATAVAPGKPACPATGLWSQCAIVERLERAGLAPRVDSTARPTEEKLTAQGILVRVGRSELELYIYDDTLSRRREQALLDGARYAAYDAPMTMAQQPTLIASANLIAILHSLSDHQRERVGDAITAGAPAAEGARP